MIINGTALLKRGPIRKMESQKIQGESGFSYGLSEVGYDIRIKQKIIYTPPDPVAYARRIAVFGGVSTGQTPWEKNHLKSLFFGSTDVVHANGRIDRSYGRTALASSIEYFDMPMDLWCEFKNKSTWARKFVDATLGTDAEPGWKGHLTIEMVFNGNNPITIEPGTGILKAVFTTTKEKAYYDGKYQNQADRPVESITTIKEAL